MGRPAPRATRPHLGRRGSIRPSRPQPQRRLRLYDSGLLLAPLPRAGLQRGRPVKQLAWWWRRLWQGLTVRLRQVRARRLRRLRRLPRALLQVPRVLPPQLGAATSLDSLAFLAQRMLLRLLPAGNGPLPSPGLLCRMQLQRRQRSGLGQRTGVRQGSSSRAGQLQARVRVQQQVPQWH